MDKKELLKLLKMQGFSDNVLLAFGKVRREDFVPEEVIKYSYENIPLHLADDSTISQPSTIAFMLELLELKSNESVLEIGSGSGYVLALLAEMTKGRIYGVELIKELALNSRRLLAKNKRIEIYCQDGKNGLIEKAPFDRILISASCDKIPTHLYGQLSSNGIIVAPVGDSIWQIKRLNGKIAMKEFRGFAFVSLK